MQYAENASEIEVRGDKTIYHWVALTKSLPPTTSGPGVNNKS